jgi:MFS family permease
MVALKHDAETGASDPIISRMVKEDKVSWIKKRNLRWLYFLLFPTCMGIEITSGFDSQMINALQIVPTWELFFGNPQGSVKGIISAAYSLGAILSLPFVGIVNDKFGRRWSIFGGSVIMIIGALIQGFSVNGKPR